MENGVSIDRSERKLSSLALRSGQARALQLNNIPAVIRRRNQPGAVVREDRCDAKILIPARGVIHRRVINPIFLQSPRISQLPVAVPVWLNICERRGETFIRMKKMMTNQ